MKSNATWQSNSSKLHINNNTGIPFPSSEKWCEINFCISAWCQWCSYQCFSEMGEKINKTKQKLIMLKLLYLNKENTKMKIKKSTKLDINNWYGKEKDR